MMTCAKPGPYCIQNEDVVEDDDLMKRLDEIEAYCHAHDFLTYKGCLVIEDFPEMAWDTENDAEWIHFLAVAKTLGVRMIYLSRQGFEKELVDEAFAGKTAAVHLGFMHNGVFHTFVMATRWYEKFLEVSHSQ